MRWPGSNMMASLMLCREFLSQQKTGAFPAGKIV